MSSTLIERAIKVLEPQEHKIILYNLLIEMFILVENVSSSYLPSILLLQILTQEYVFPRTMSFLFCNVYNSLSSINATHVIMVVDPSYIIAFSFSNY